MKSVKLGNQDVKLYLGDTLIYPKASNVIKVTRYKPTSQNVEQLVSFNEKPQGPQPLVFVQNITRPTLMYLVYPVSWETVQGGEITKPIIKDSNNFEVGFEIDEDDPTILYKGITYRLLNIELGVNDYTIKF